MIRSFKKVAFILVLPLILTGCWDYADINTRDIIISIGVDDINGNVEFTGEAAKLTATSPQNRGSMETYKYVSLGKNFEDSRAEYDTKIPGPYFSGAARCIVFSERQGEKGIESYINRVNSITGFRNSVLLTISKESPSDLFSKKIDNDISIGYAIQDTIKRLDDDGEALYRTVQQIKSDIDFKNIGYFLPYVTIDKNTVKYLGMGAMKDSKLIGMVSFEDSNGFLFVLSKKPVKVDAVVNPSNEKNLLSLRTTLVKRSIKTNYQNKEIHIYINLKLKSQLQYQYKIETLSEQDIKKVESVIANEIKEDIISAISRSQNEFKSDVFGFARYFKADNQNIYKSIDWNEEYPKAIFHVNVDTTIVNTNLLDPNAKKAN